MVISSRTPSSECNRTRSNPTSRLATYLAASERITPADSDVLNLLIGSLDVTIFMTLGAWVIGPRSFQYLFPQIGKAVQGAGALVNRLIGTDRHREDDER